MDPARKEDVMDARRKNDAAGESWRAFVLRTFAATREAWLKGVSWVDRPVCQDLKHTDLSGRVKPMNATKPSSVPRATARERLLAAADELFYENSIIQ